MSAPAPPQPLEPAGTGAVIGPRRRTVHVHGAEVSTDRSQLSDYAETLALLVAIVAFLAAAWISAAPSPDADIPVPAAPSAETITFVRAPDSTRDVVQPDPDGAASTAVERPTGTTPAPFTNPAPNA